MKMDLAETKACLDEYRRSLDATCGMLRPMACAEDDLRSALDEMNARLIATLDVRRHEAAILAIVVQEELSARMAEILEFRAAELNEVLVALNELKLAVSKVDLTRADHLRVIEADKAAKEAIPVRSPLSLALEKLRRDSKH
jgi:hypothetical protein